DGSVSALYLMGDRAVVLSQEYQYSGGPIGYGGAGGILMIYPWWGYNHTQTVVTTVDLTDRTAPTVAAETKLDGWLVDSRAVNGRVYTVVQNSLDMPY